MQGFCKSYTLLLLLPQYNLLLLIGRKFTFLSIFLFLIYSIWVSRAGLIGLHSIINAPAPTAPCSFILVVLQESPIKLAADAWRCCFVCGGRLISISETSHTFSICRWQVFIWSAAFTHMESNLVSDLLVAWGISCVNKM